MAAAEFAAWEAAEVAAAIIAAVMAAADGAAAMMTAVMARSVIWFALPRLRVDDPPGARLPSPGRHPASANVDRHE
jgi:hypothetical protein